MKSIGLLPFKLKGAFFAFPKVDVTAQDDDTICDRLLKKEEVACIPNNAFGAGGEGFARCSYPTSYDPLEEALEHSKRFVKKN